MKRNKWMFTGGLLLVIGSVVLLPFIGLGASVLLGEDYIDRILKSNAEAVPLIAVVAIAAMILIPFIGMFLIFGSILIPYFSNLKAKNKIVSQGKPAEARILALADTGTRINNNPLVSFSLEVYSFEQPPFRTEVSETVSVIHLPSYQPGKIINVRYLPGTNEVAIIGTKIS
jgi:hypothetical protein